MKKRALEFIDKFHLVYLGILPAVATYSSLRANGTAVPALVFFGGVVAVSVYLVVVISYTRPSKSLLSALTALLDGPLWILGLYLWKGVVVSPVIDAYLIDGLAVWLSIVFLAVTTTLPTRNQRIATLAFAFVAVGAVLFAFWPHLSQHIFGDHERMIWLAAGILQAAIFRCRLLDDGTPARDGDVATKFVLVFLLIWIVAMCGGNALHELSLRGR